MNPCFMMKTTTKVTSTYNCSLERAFKSPMLCDVKKVHTGYGVMPKLTHCTEDENWGKVGGSRKVFMDKNLFFKGGEAALDTVLIRTENKYWKIEISNFKYWAMGFNKFQGEWFTEDNNNGTVNVNYKYTLFSKHILAYPFHWLVTKTIWRNYMKHAMENIKIMAKNNEPYVHK